MTFFSHSLLGNDSGLPSGSAELARDHSGDVASADTFRNQRFRNMRQFGPCCGECADVAGFVDFIAERYGLVSEIRSELASGTHSRHHTTMREWLEAPAT